MDIISTTSYQGITGFDWTYDADFSKSDLLGFKETSPYNSFSEELRFESKKGISDLKWVAGLFYLRERTDFDYDAMLNGNRLQINDTLTAYGIPYLLDTLKQVNTGPWNTNGLAVFCQATYTIIDKLDITAGLRYEKQLMDINAITKFVYSGSLKDSMPALIPLYFGFLNEIDTMNRSDASDFVSQKYALSYSIDDLNMIYVSASSGFHGGGYNSGSNKKYPYYSPENTWNFELGYKTTMLDNKLRINTDVFYIDWRNQQLLTVGDLSSPLQTIRNAGSTEIKGFELELSAIVLKGFNIDFSFGYLDSKLKEYTFRDSVNGKDSVYNFAGNNLPFSPNISSMLRLKYDYPVSLLNLEGKLSCNFEYQYIGDYYSSHMNLFKTSPRSLLNIKAGWFNEQFDLYLWMKNIADYHYIYGTYEYRGEMQAFLGSPRTLGLSLNFKF
jgi:iron complex outermembrane receptor protein